MQPNKASAGRGWPIAADCAVVFLLTAILVWPMFTTGYFNNWASIESTFIADGRFLKENLPHPGWQPLWYGGTRFEYIYPPALRYGTALLAKFFDIPEVRAYRLYTAFLYCLGIAGVYLLARIGTRSRGFAWIGAAATALVSPSFLFLSVVRHDSEFHTPQRLHVLVKYGEGPHISALSLLPFALALSLIALRRPGAKWPAAAACLCAAVVLNNFYGATALAMFFGVLVWSVWVTHLDRRVWARALGIAALAYGLSAFWLSPSYFRITLANLSLVSTKGNARSVWIAAAVALIMALLTWIFARGRKDLAYPVFIWCSAAVFALDVLGHFGFGFRLAGEPGRLIPELDLVFILSGIEVLRRLWLVKSPVEHGFRRLAPKLACVLLVFFGLFPGRRYAAHAWEIYPPDPNYKNRVEYRISEWMARNMPESRAFVTGSIRFWYDVWHNLYQVGGGSEQGLLNRNITPASWELILGPDPEPGILWLVCLGADAVVVPDKTSKEIYHDFAHPKKFAGVLPVLYDDGEGNVIYRVPRRFPGLARVVDARRAMALQPVRHNFDVERLRPYAEVAEKGSDVPAPMTREGPSRIRIRALVEQGQAVLVQSAYDPNWRAYSGGTSLPVRGDALGQILIETPPGRHEILLVFELPFEIVVGRIVTGLCLAGVAFVLIRRQSTTGNRSLRSRLGY